LLAGAVAWFFEVGPDRPFEAVVVPTVAWAFGSALVASLVGLAALSFFEVIFDITTALRLLDVTDRNHPALELLQQGAWGTFNHSLMVGTLAETAAKAIGANSLLARAAAYYHDLGKTENPSFFIENQFGISNPHDELPPEKSVEILRRHVTDGVELARRYRIPSEVVAGIVSHHGDSVMRYFYERARQLYGADAVNTDDYRHTGRKPDTKETAILMLADSLEGACRAVFQLEDPSPERIAQVVDGVMGEKIDDGQLSNSPLTMGELTRVRLAFIEALVGHYHQRIPYPNFPGRALPAGGPAVRPGS
ncbi:MAG: HDIG domain-containing metalloprotein, partial [Acidimicrobiia bacterium]